MTKFALLLCLALLTGAVAHAQTPPEPAASAASAPDAAASAPPLSAADGARSLDVVCGAVRAALDVRQPVAEPLASHLRSAVDDRAQLRHLDYLLALGIARRLAGKRGVRAFRKVSYASLRRSGLPSLTQQRNFRREKGKDEGGAD